MSHLSMRPAAVTSWGAKARGIGTDVAANDSQVNAAAEEGTAAGLAGFTTCGALSSYTGLFSRVVRSVGDEVHRNGTDLTSSASLVTGHDAASSAELTTAAASIAAINTHTAVAA